MTLIFRDPSKKKEGTKRDHLHLASAAGGGKGRTGKKKAHTGGGRPVCDIGREETGKKADWHNLMTTASVSFKR